MTGKEPSPVYPKHYCGVFGVFGHPDAAQLTYYGLYALQHRGQESAGIASIRDGAMQVHRGMGLVSQVFKDADLRELSGTSAIGHTRYSTTGSSHLRNAQPLTGDSRLGQIAIAHNGNLTNSSRLVVELEDAGAIFQTSVDSEIILHLIAHPRDGRSDISLVQAVRRLEGAYSVVMLTENEMIGFRDPFGFRPLSLGRVGDAWVLSSETCAFDLVGAEFVRDIEPGEIVVINKGGVKSMQAFPGHPRRAFCVFEYVYFARPDSNLDGRNVYQVRVEMGRQLAREHPIEADVVVPVPDSGNSAALGYSQETGIPYEMAFVRNHYIGRSFLQPTQLIRDFNVRVKLNLIRELVQGKRVIIVDDSIVRGTTCKARVNNLKEAGAREVHVLVSCPPHRHPCVYGIDFPDPSKLMAATHTLEGIRDFINADSLHYLSMEGMIRATGRPAGGFCRACYDGDYPVPYDNLLAKNVMEKRRDRINSLSEALAEEEKQPPLL